MPGIGIAYAGVIEMFPSSDIKILKMSTGVKEKQVVARIQECFLTKGTVITYHFKDMEFYLKYLEESGWYKLPLANKFGARKFNRMETDKFFWD